MTDSLSSAHERGSDAVARRSTPATSRQAAVRRYTARNALLRRQGYKNYGDYLRSAHWRRLRAEYRASDLPQSCICGEWETQLHHITYERVGQERLSDLVPLCPSCHTLVHVLEWRGDGDLTVNQLTDAERAEAGRKWLAALVEERRAEAAAQQRAERQHVLSLSFAARLQRARAAARVRHVDISHQVHLLKRSSGKTDQQLTKRLRIIEALAYGWEDWDPRTGEGNLTERLRNAA